jgi:hypothetical protein
MEVRAGTALVALLLVLWRGRWVFRWLRKAVVRGPDSRSLRERRQFGSGGQDLATAGAATWCRFVHLM